MNKSISSNNNSEFHNKHEYLTNLAYEKENMLPARYVFILTNLCNLRCGFCFQSKNALKDTMTLDDWTAVARQLPEYSRITFTGGEPFLFKDFETIFSYIGQRYDCNIITNGLLLDKKKIDFILSVPRCKVLSISIDDVGNTLRGLTPQQWEYLVSMMKLFIKKRNEKGVSCVLDIKTTIVDENASSLFAIYKYFREEIGCDSHAFQLLKGSPIQHADTMFSFKDILEPSIAKVYSNFSVIQNELKKISEYNKKTKNVSYLHPKVSTLDEYNKIDEIEYVNSRRYDKTKFCICKYPWSSVHINVDGNVFPCLAVSMGNVKHESLSDIISGKMFMRFKTLIKKEGTIEACNRCGWLKPKENVIR